MAMDEIELKNENDSEKIIMASEATHENVASKFSASAVLIRSFLVLFKHPFVFLGLTILSLIPGFIVIAWMWNIPVVVIVALDVVCGLMIQGAVGYGVFEVLRGNAARFGKILSRGMARFIPLFLSVLLAALLYSFFLFLTVHLLYMFEIRLRRWDAYILALSVLLSGWCVFASACVVERLTPLDSLHRSLSLTEGCRLKIASLYLPCLFATRILHTIAIRYVGVNYSLLTPLFGPAFAFYCTWMIRLFSLAVPLTFTFVMTGVIYCSLREVKEGVVI